MRPFAPSLKLRRAGLTVARAALVCVATAAISMSAAAESVVTVPLPCMDSQEFEAFKARHAERPVAFGATSAGALVQRIEGPEGGWTLVLVVGDGLYCVLATGEGWVSRNQGSVVRDQEAKRRHPLIPDP